MLGGGALALYVKLARIKKNGLQAQATVQDIQRVMLPLSWRSGYRMTPTLAMGGRSHVRQFALSKEDAARHPRGSLITVLYDQSTPSRCYRPDQKPWRVFRLILALATSMMAATTIIASLGDLTENRVSDMPPG